MRQIAYFSTAAEPQTEDLIQDILATARAHNATVGVTGLLVGGGNRYMQVLEGPRAAVTQLFDKIRKDDRHISVATLINRTAFKPSFEGWSMAYRREPALGEFDRFPDVVRFLTSRIDDPVLRDQFRRFSAPFIANPPDDARNPWAAAG